MKKKIAVFLSVTFICLWALTFLAGWYGVYQINLTLDKLAADAERMKTLADDKDEKRDLDELKFMIKKCRGAEWFEKPTCGQDVVNKSQKIFAKLEAN